MTTNTPDHAYKCDACGNTEKFVYYRTTYDKVIGDGDRDYVEEYGSDPSDSAEIDQGRDGPLECAKCHSHGPFTDTLDVDEQDRNMGITEQEEEEE